MNETLNPKQTAKLAEMLPYVAPWLAVETTRSTTGAVTHAFLWDGTKVVMVIGAKGETTITANGEPMTRASGARLYMIAAFVQEVCGTLTPAAADLVILKERDPDKLGAAEAYEQTHEKRWPLLFTFHHQLAQAMPHTVTIEPAPRMRVATDDGRFLARDNTWTREASQARLFRSEDEAKDALRAVPELVLDNVLHTEPARRAS